MLLCCFFFSVERGKKSSYGVLAAAAVRLPTTATSAALSSTATTALSSSATTTTTADAVPATSAAVPAGLPWRNGQPIGSVHDLRAAPAAAETPPTPPASTSSSTGLKLPPGFHRVEAKKGGVGGFFSGLVGSDSAGSVGVNCPPGFTAHVQLGWQAECGSRHPIPYVRQV